jgi:DNA polymerase-4
MNSDENRPKKIIHLDMDAFYASVEVLDNADFKGKPVIVGGRKRRGVVSSASYEARRMGVHSAQPISAAMRLCPKGIFLPVRMNRYKEVSQQVFEIFQRFTPLVEPVSIDEAFLDVTGCIRLYGPPKKIAEMIKETVKREIGLTVSAGVAPTKFAAKIASDLNKPDGLVVVEEDKMKHFLDPLPVEKLWGVGESTLKSLMRLNIRTIGDLGKSSPELLTREFGVHGVKMHQLAQGIDNRDVEPIHELKSIGHEETYVQDIRDKGSAKREILLLATKVARRMRRYGLSGRTVTLKVKYNDFVQITRSISLPKGTDDAQEIVKICYELLEKTAIDKRPVRLLGVSLSGMDFFGEKAQLSLFNREMVMQKIKDLNRALDEASDKFGEGVIRPAALFQESSREKRKQ